MLDDAPAAAALVTALVALLTTLVAIPLALALDVTASGNAVVVAYGGSETGADDVGIADETDAVAVAVADGPAEDVASSAYEVETGPAAGTWSVPIRNTPESVYTTDASPGAVKRSW